MFVYPSGNPCNLSHSIGVNFLTAMLVNTVPTLSCTPPLGLFIVWLVSLTVVLYVSKAFDTYNTTVSDTNQTIKSPNGGVQESVGTVFTNMAVRKLTPIECERLQGFPDGYTNIKENCPDGHRYKAMGNSMAVPVMKWIGTRINNYKEDTNAV